LSLLRTRKLGDCCSFYPFLDLISSSFLSLVERLVPFLHSEASRLFTEMGVKAFLYADIMVDLFLL
jgi:hypothetical protein